MDEQQLLLVDNNDKFLGYKDRKLCHTGDGFHHRAFVVCLFNNKNQILLQKRKHALWDGFWDVSAVSHPLHLENGDESYDQAAARALKKEIGVEGVKLKKIGGFNYFVRFGQNCENEYCAVLLGKWNNAVIPNKEEVYECKWIDKNLFLKECKEKKEIYTPWAIYTAEVLSQRA